MLKPILCAVLLALGSLPALACDGDKDGALSLEGFNRQWMHGTGVGVDLWRLPEQLPYRVSENRPAPAKKVAVAAASEKRD